MAAPNLLNMTTLTGVTTYLTPSATSAVVLLPNAAASNTVLRVNQIVATNVSGSAVNVTVSIYTNGAVAQGLAPSGGTAFPVVSTVSVPANTALVAVDKTTGIYLQEGVSITVTSGTASGITYSISYELIA